MKLFSTVVLLLVGVTSAQDICDEIGNSTASFCSCESLTKGGQTAANITCASTSLLKFSAEADLYPCAKTAYADITLQYDGETYGPETIDVGQSDKWEVPGLSYDISIGGKTYTADVYLEASMTGSAKDFTAAIELDVCVEIYGVQICGSQISKDWPLNIISGEITTTGIC